MKRISFILLEEYEFVRNKLVNLAIDIWGLTYNQVVNRRVAVKVYPFDKNSSFSNIKNLYALYEIDLDNPVCENYINDVPYKVNDIITPEILTTLENLGLVVYKELD
jgi:hypothetical protein